MKKIGTKQIVPLVLAVFAVVFAVVGFTQLGFWEDVDGPQPGFFPAIMAIVMFLASIASFFQSLKEEKAARYERDEMMVIAGGAGIIAGSFIIGLLPSCYLFVILWRMEGNSHCPCCLYGHFHRCVPYVAGGPFSNGAF